MALFFNFVMNRIFLGSKKRQPGLQKQQPGLQNENWKIAICSDVHEHLQNLERMLEICKQEKVQTILCAGDLISPILARRFVKAGIPLILVKGNNDGEVLGLANTLQKPHQFYIENYEGVIGGRRIFMKHTPNGCEAIAQSQKFDLVIFGHTHEKLVRKIGNTTLLNPGELCGMLSKSATFYLYEINKNIVKEICLEN